MSSPKLHPGRPGRPETHAGRRRVRLGLSLGGIALTLISLGLLRRLSEAPAPPPLTEVPRSELACREGRLYRLHETNPFAGFLVEFHDDGSLKSRSRIAHGLLHGPSKGWHTNRQLAVREYFQNGISHGLRTKWHPNGQKLSEVTVVDGKLQGTFQSWHANGEHAEEIELKDGQPDGLSKAYYASGYLKAQARLRNGALLNRTLWKDGERRDASQGRH